MRLTIQGSEYLSWKAHFLRKQAKSPASRIPHNQTVSAQSEQHNIVLSARNRPCYAAASRGTVGPGLSGSCCTAAFLSYWVPLCNCVSEPNMSYGTAPPLGTVGPVVQLCLRARWAPWRSSASGISGPCGAAPPSRWLSSILGIRRRVWSVQFGFLVLAVSPWWLVRVG